MPSIQRSKVRITLCQERFESTVKFVNVTVSNASNVVVVPQHLTATTAASYSCCSRGAGHRLPPSASRVEQRLLPITAFLLTI